MCVLTAASPSGNILIRNLADWPRVIIPPTGQLAAATKLPNRPNKQICKLHINSRLASKTQQGFHHDKWNEPYGILCISQAQQRSYCFTANEKELLARALSPKINAYLKYLCPQNQHYGPFQTYEVGDKTLLRYSRQLTIKWSCPIWYASAFKHLSCIPRTQAESLLLWGFTELQSFSLFLKIPCVITS